MRLRKRNIIITAVVILLVVGVVLLLNSEARDFHAKYDGVDLSADVEGIGRSDTYAGYLTSHATGSVPTETVLVDVNAFTGDGEAQEKDGVPCVYTADGNYTTWTVQVNEPGFYQIQIEYLNVDSRGVDVERSLYINGELPFSGASSLCFSRQWTDGGEVRQDNQGNDIRPTQIEYYSWQQVSCKDSMGYEDEPYRFYFEAGENTVSLKAVNEPMLIRGIQLIPVQERVSYADYLTAQTAAASSANETWQTVIQGEDAVLRSSPSLYARYDRSSPATLPNSVDHTVLNYIGGDSWRTAGQWIEWEFEVPEDGYYNITVKARQQYQRGSVSCRTLYIDGEVPFEEAASLEFNYGTNWDMRTVCDANGTPCRFYLKAGKHSIRLEATLGAMGSILQDMENSIYRLNQIYRKILVLTGVNPDRFRDYNISGIYPEIIEAMDLESKRLYKLVDDTVAITGQKSDRIAVAQTLAVQLENFVKYNERITMSFTNFKDNITSLGTALQNMGETKLDVDMIIVSGEKAKLESPAENILTKTIHEIKSCVASFFVDYNSLGDKYEKGKTQDLIEVWIVTGRDQSTILKTLVDVGFTSQTGIKVNVKLVAADAILTAVVAGNGPDVVLSVDNWFAVNYAMRNAVEDLTQFADYEEVAANFYGSALAALTYDDGNGNGVYGLPETQLYSVLFYRTDVLAELGLSVPSTWKELIAMLPTIQGNNMSVGVAYPDISNPDISALVSMIYQNGGAIYDTDAKHTTIDSEAGVVAFEQYTSLYNDYGLPTVYDFVSRFRSGEMPIGVAMYNTYNTLSVSAPEIRGLWDFTLLPGTLREDGSINRSVHSAGACCMMIATSDEQVKNNAWQFMKWWASTDTQVSFGREIESVLGSSARYPTANKNALEQLAWSTDQLKVLKEQQGWTVGFREIAGGYSTTRHITNAIRKVINEKDDARETLLNYARTINDEITIKRREFNLPTD